MSAFARFRVIFFLILLFAGAWQSTLPAMAQDPNLPGSGNCGLIDLGNQVYLYPTGIPSYFNAAKLKALIEIIPIFPRRQRPYYIYFAPSSEGTRLFGKLQSGNLLVGGTAGVHWDSVNCRFESVLIEPVFRPNGTITWIQTNSRTKMEIIEMTMHEFSHLAGDANHGELCPTFYNDRDPGSTGPIDGCWWEMIIRVAYQNRCATLSAAEAEYCTKVQNALAQ